MLNFTHKKKKLRGYTFIEIIAVMGLVGLMLSVSLPFTIDQLQATRVEATASDISSAMYLSQQNASSGKENKNYGISFTTNGYTTYKWEDPNPIEEIAVVEFPTNTTISSINLTDTSSEITFQSGSFRPSTDGTLQVTDGGAISIIRVNSEGLIEHYTL